MSNESIEVHGRTTEEAIRAALDRLGVTRDEVDIEVLSEGRSGVFGVGSQEARVRVTVVGEEYDYDEEEEDEFNREAPQVQDDDAQLARETLERMLDLLDFPNVVTVRGIQQENGKATILLDVAGDDVGLIIGRHGETLSSLQFLLNACLGKRLPRDTRIVVDVEHYRERREQSLRAIAMRAADRARRERRPVTLQPMPPNERRIIHLALQSSRYVSTESTGEGPERRVVISPKQTFVPRRPNYGYPRGMRG
ncbi:MAG TPA: RNA-binding cell elongation regulator Jag/EloR [Chloroflexota bacterium]|nr:RNA-binding cell elongation regulator Jag/EloR [Chloroflexota bacterium]